MRLSIYTDRPPEFWLSMGPFFASRAVRREMPYLVDEPDYVWFVIREPREISGFAACHIDKHGVGHLSHLYVKPERRANGVAARLIQERLDWLRKQGVKRASTTASSLSKPQLEKHGFQPVKERGSYTVMEVELG